MIDTLYWLFITNCDWWASLFGLTCMKFVGDKKWWAHWIGVGGQGFWLLVALTTGKYGILIATFFYLGMYLRNAIKWTRERPQ